LGNTSICIPYKFTLEFATRRAQKQIGTAIQWNTSSYDHSDDFNLLGWPRNKHKRNEVYVNI
jgi:hypothetical protein